MRQLQEVNLMDSELLMTAARSVAVYAVMLAVIRALGKRTIGNLAAFDLLVALMLGEVVDEIIYGDVSFSQGLMAIVPIAAVEYGNSWLSYVHHGIGKILEGKPTIVLRHGEFQRRGMRLERMNEFDVMSALRLHGIEDVREVKLAIVEPDGEVSVIEEDWALAAEKADVSRAEDEGRRRRLRGKDEPGPRQSTTSEYALG
jgi:uncharacterized membrane protein YcaP (DUF421 family)